MYLKTDLNFIKIYIYYLNTSNTLEAPLTKRVSRLFLRVSFPHYLNTITKHLVIFYVNSLVDIKL